MLIISNEGEGRNGEPRQMSRMHEKTLSQTGSRAAYSQNSPVDLSGSTKLDADAYRPSPCSVLFHLRAPPSSHPIPSIAFDLLGGGILWLPFVSDAGHFHFQAPPPPRRTIAMATPETIPNTSGRAIKAPCAEQLWSAPVPPLPASAPSN